MSEQAGAQLDFREILSSVGAQRFFKHYWQQRALMSPIAIEQLRLVLGAIGPLDVPRLCGLAREGSRAWLANDFIAHSVIPVNASNAVKFFDAGATLYFVNIPIARLTDALADFLGAPRQKVIASLFLTPARGGAVPHFDKNENFTIQLTGTKEWIVDEKPAVASPADGYVLGQAVPRSLAPLAPLAARGKLPVLLEPGTLLYVPRGTVHQTAAGTVSWSLNLSYSPSMWLDLLIVGLRRQLSSSDRWRRTVTGISAASDPYASSGNMLPELIEELGELLKDPGQVERLAREFLENPDG